MKCLADEQGIDVTDLWNILIMFSNAKILVMKEHDKFTGGIDYATLFVLRLLHAIILEQKLTKTYPGLYWAINRPWAKIGDFTGGTYFIITISH